MDSLAGCESDRLASLLQLEGNRTCADCGSNGGFTYSKKYKNTNSRLKSTPSQNQIGPQSLLEYSFVYDVLVFTEE